MEGTAGQKTLSSVGNILERGLLLGDQQGPGERRGGQPLPCPFDCPLLRPASSPGPPTGVPAGPQLCLSVQDRGATPQESRVQVTDGSLPERGTGRRRSTELRASVCLPLLRTTMHPRKQAGRRHRACPDNSPAGLVLQRDCVHPGKRRPHTLAQTLISPTTTWGTGPAERLVGFG